MANRCRTVRGASVLAHRQLFRRRERTKIAANSFVQPGKLPTRRASEPVAGFRWLKAPSTFESRYTAAGTGTAPRTSCPASEVRWMQSSDSNWAPGAALGKKRRLAGTGRTHEQDGLPRGSCAAPACSMTIRRRASGGSTDRGGSAERSLRLRAKRPDPIALDLKDAQTGEEQCVLLADLAKHSVGVLHRHAAMQDRTSTQPFPANCEAHFRRGFRHTQFRQHASTASAMPSSCGLHLGPCTAKRAVRTSPSAALAVRAGRGKRR